jgi:hypothetical protein
MGETRNAHKSLIIKPEGRKPLVNSDVDRRTIL